MIHFEGETGRWKVRRKERKNKNVKILSICYRLWDSQLVIPYTVMNGFLERYQFNSINKANTARWWEYEDQWLSPCLYRLTIWYRNNSWRKMWLTKSPLSAPEPRVHAFKVLSYTLEHWKHQWNTWLLGFYRVKLLDLNMASQASTWKEHFPASGRWWSLCLPSERRENYWGTLLWV